MMAKLTNSILLQRWIIPEDSFMTTGPFGFCTHLFLVFFMTIIWMVYPIGTRFLSRELVPIKLEKEALIIRQIIFTWELMAGFTSQLATLVFQRQRVQMERLLAGVGAELYEYDQMARKWKSTLGDYETF